MSSTISTNSEDRESSINEELSLEESNEQFQDAPAPTPVNLTSHVTNLRPTGIDHDERITTNTIPSMPNLNPCTCHARPAPSVRVCGSTENALNMQRVEKYDDLGASSCSKESIQLAQWRRRTPRHRKRHRVDHCKNNENNEGSRDGDIGDPARRSGRRSMPTDIISDTQNCSELFIPRPQETTTRLDDCISQGEDEGIIPPLCLRTIRLPTASHPHKSSRKHACSRGSSRGTKRPRTRTRPQWERVLWKRQNFEDYYMPTERLVSVIMKGPRNTMTFAIILSRVCFITQKMLLVLVLVYVNKGLVTHEESPSSLNAIGPSAVFFVQCIIWGSLPIYGLISEYMGSWRDAIDIIEIESGQRDTRDLIERTSTVHFSDACPHPTLTNEANSSLTESDTCIDDISRTNTETMEEAIAPAKHDAIGDQVERKSVSPISGISHSDRLRTVVGPNVSTTDPVRPSSSSWWNMTHWTTRWNHVKQSTTRRFRFRYVWIRIVNMISLLFLYATLYLITVKTHIVRSVSAHISSDSASNIVGLFLIAHIIKSDAFPERRPPESHRASSTITSSSVLGPNSFGPTVSNVNFSRSHSAIVPRQPPLGQGNHRYPSQGLSTPDIDRFGINVKSHKQSRRDMASSSASRCCSSRVSRATGRPPVFYLGPQPYPLRRQHSEESSVDGEEDLIRGPFSLPPSPRGKLPPLPTAVVSTPSRTMNDPTAMNLGIFAGILMASRMRDPYHCLALISTAVMIFVFFPMIRSYFVPNGTFAWNLCVTPTLLIIANAIMNQTDESPVMIKTVHHIFAIMICAVPITYLRLQNRQVTIQGPWDIPIVVSSKPPGGY